MGINCNHLKMPVKQGKGIANRLVPMVDLSSKEMKMLPLKTNRIHFPHPPEWALSQLLSSVRWALLMEPVRSILSALNSE